MPMAQVLQVTKPARTKPPKAPGNDRKTTRLTASLCQGSPPLQEVVDGARKTGLNYAPDAAGEAGMAVLSLFLGKPDRPGELF
jgi:hypothetical protein